jgi:hypothetical protein
VNGMPPQRQTAYHRESPCTWRSFKSLRFRAGSSDRPIFARMCEDSRNSANQAIGQTGRKSQKGRRSAHGAAGLVEFRFAMMQQLARYRQNRRSLQTAVLMKQGTTAAPSEAPG